MNMIMGLIEPTKGECFVSGYSILDQMEQVQKNIGVWFIFFLLFILIYYFF